MDEKTEAKSNETNTQDLTISVRIRIQTQEV
jgi:hypothetical protein